MKCCFRSRTLNRVLTPYRLLLFILYPQQTDRFRASIDIQLNPNKNIRHSSYTLNINILVIMNKVHI